MGLSAGRYPELEAFTSFCDLLEHHAAARLILVDMPIGLPTGQMDAQIGPKPRSFGGRSCDWEAKGLLYAHQNRVFLTPTRSTVNCTVRSSEKHDDKYEKAKKVEHDASGANLTKQSFGLVEKFTKLITCYRVKLRRLEKPILRSVFGLSITTVPYVPEKRSWTESKIGKGFLIMF